MNFKERVQELKENMICDLRVTEEKIHNNMQNGKREDNKELLVERKMLKRFISDLNDAMPKARRS